jgi:hypothetical protein
LPRDRYGKVDKSEPDDEEYPRDWTPEQRLKATWEKLQAFRDGKERDDALANPGSLLTTPPASAATRAKAMQDFQLSFGDLDDDDPDEALLHVNPLLVRCPYCRAVAGSHCTKAGMPGQPRELLTAIAGHPARIEAAAVAAGYSEAEVQAIVTAAQKRSVKRERSKWSERDNAKPPPEPRAPDPEPEPPDYSAEPDPEPQS